MVGDQVALGRSKYETGEGIVRDCNIRGEGVQYQEMGGNNIIN